MVLILIGIVVHLRRIIFAVLMKHDIDLASDDGDELKEKYDNIMTNVNAHKHHESFFDLKHHSQDGMTND